MRQRFMSGGHFMKGCNFAQCQRSSAAPKAPLCKGGWPKGWGIVLTNEDMECRIRL